MTAPFPPVDLALVEALERTFKRPPGQPLNNEAAVAQENFDRGRQDVIRFLRDQLARQTKNNAILKTE